MIRKSSWPDVSIPSDVPLHELVLARADQRGEQAALIDGPSGRTLTYRELARQVRSVAAGMAQRGLGKGDVVAIYSPNTPEYAVAFYAAATIGAVNTTANPLYTADELAGQLEDSAARVLIAAAPFIAKARQAAERVGVEQLYVFGEAEGATSFSELAADPSDCPAVSVDPQRDLVALPYSSGTTGIAKGVMLTHYNLVANLHQFSGLMAFRDKEVLIGVLPFFHIYGMTVIMSAGLWHGATIVTMPRFDLQQFLEMLQHHRVTRAYVVPPIVLALAKHPLVDGYDLAALDEILSGAAPLGAELSAAAAERLGCLVKQGYGLTETSPVTHVSPPDRDAICFGSAGQLLPNTECMIVDVESGDPVAEQRRPGEIWIRGPQVMRGYLRNPEATSNAIDAEGWFHTGDIGYVDGDGNYFVVDRLKELIKYKGYQVAPAELEAVLLSHPRISDAAVVPSPDVEAGEVPKAFVVADGDLSVEQVLSFVAERVAPHKKVRRAELVESIPKSPSGKILRRVLVERERAARAPVDEG